MVQPSSLWIGLDVGSTTVKATAVDPDNLQILWSEYRRHQTRQPEVVRAMLADIAATFPDIPPAAQRICITGSGSGPLVEPLGAHYVQEVNAVTMAVEILHPDAGSVVELGGQDAKIIIFKVHEETGARQTICSMNDKCASGTGATIDKCLIKVGMREEDVGRLRFDNSSLHHVAAKCGVFAETDIVNLVKTGIPSEEILCSLANAIVQQNLSVLTRGNTLRPQVVLLGGPNTYLPFLVDCWRLRIPETWRERGFAYPEHIPVEELIFVPENSQYYAAYGAVLFGRHDLTASLNFTGLAGLDRYIEHGRKARLAEHAGPPLVRSRDELERFAAEYSVPHFEPARFKPGQVVRAALGLDGGSTSSKCVLVSEDGQVLKKEYQLSGGNPIRDMKEMFARLASYVTDQQAELEVIGFGVTGYAGDVMEKALRADANIVETVAHAESALRFFPDADVVCDIGGQDIKVLFLRRGDIQNFRLSNQCSAGNGMLLQAMADQFGLPVTEYASHAFDAELSPRFSYGCAVFLDTDRVNFQKEGFSKEELLAGLALVLPKNIWQYVVQIPRMAELGQHFVLQGGTQHNLAAVKAQVDYIRERVPGAKISVHPYTGEAGAFGAAMEALRVVQRRGSSSFVGLEAALGLEFATRNDEDTICHFCPNECSRTFIDSWTPDGERARYISGFSCEKGTVEDIAALQTLQRSRKARMQRFPNLVEEEASLAFKNFFKHEPLPGPEQQVDDWKVQRTLFGGVRRLPIRRPFESSSPEAAARRRSLRIGMPRVLNFYSTGPFFRSYFQALGIRPAHLVWSDSTSEELWQAGGKYGAVDPCYPAKVVQAHIHNLLFDKHGKKPLDYVFFPGLTHVPSFVENVMDTASCPIVAGTPNVIRAAFTKEQDFFAVRGIEYLDPALTLAEPHLLAEQLWAAWGERLDVSADENRFAVRQGLAALREFDARMEARGREILSEVEARDGLAILLLGRPYHNDPGLNHGVLEEFQALGYPILSIRSIPKDKAWLQRFFAQDLAQGRVSSALDIGDVWPENFSANSVQKVWAAKFAARHPNVAVLDLSSFKCGHDAPTYGLIDSILAAAGCPFSALHDVDANKPSGSIKIRVLTYAHTLKLQRERLEDRRKKERLLGERLAAKRRELLAARATS